MDSNIEIEVKLPECDMRMVFGQFDENVILIENRLFVNIVLRNNTIKIVGKKENVQNTEKVLKKLCRLAQKNEIIDIQRVKYILEIISKEENSNIDSISDQPVVLTHLGKPVKCKTLGQTEYIKSIKQNTIVFGVGPAGTGKTYLAMAMAVNAFKRNEVSKIILTRPAIEAGEKLGFLPGDLQSKVDPYLRPLYDALFEIMGPETFDKNMERGLIEVAPLAYMRGRTLNNAFIVLDEAQNTTTAQMKMFLTRVGFNSKVVVTGDLTQIDLPSEKMSGLTSVIKVLKDIEGIGFSHLTKSDVVRHPIVQSIIEAYELYENKSE